MRVSINFYGRVTGSLGVCEMHHDERRTIEIPDRFTYIEAKEAARVALYTKQLPDDVVYEAVEVHRVKFN